jgi:hypothetical protein
MFFQTSRNAAPVTLALDATITQNSPFFKFFIGFNSLRWSLFPCQIAGCTTKLMRRTYEKSECRNNKNTGLLL